MCDLAVYPTMISDVSKDQTASRQGSSVKCLTIRSVYAICEEATMSASGNCGLLVMHSCDT